MLASWSSCFGLTLLCSAVATLILTIFVIRSIGRETIFVWGAINTASWVGLLPLWAICCRLFPVTVSASGLKSFNGFGVYSLIPWDALKQQPILNLAGLKYFRFKRDGLKAAILVPFDLDDPRLFTNEMEQYLGADSPIIANLRQEWKLPVIGEIQS